MRKFKDYLIEAVKNSNSEKLNITQIINIIESEYTKNLEEIVEKRKANLNSNAGDAIKIFENLIKMFN